MGQALSPCGRQEMGSGPGWGSSPCGGEGLGVGNNLLGMRNIHRWISPYPRGKARPAAILPSPPTATPPPCVRTWGQPCCWHWAPSPQGASYHKPQMSAPTPHCVTPCPGAHLLLGGVLAYHHPDVTQPLVVLTRWHVGPSTVCGHVGGHEPRLRGWLVWGRPKLRRRDGNPLGLSHNGGDAI